MADSQNSGAGWGFPPRFLNNGGDVRLVTGGEDIKESLEILFSTVLKERLYYPGYGCDLKRFMFEEVNQTLVTGLEKMIRDAVYDYEPRIEVLKIEISESETDAYVLLINISYVIKDLNSQQNMILPFSLI